MTFEQVNVFTVEVPTVPFFYEFAKAILTEQGDTNPSVFLTSFNAHNNWLKDNTQAANEVLRAHLYINKSECTRALEAAVEGTPLSNILETVARQIRDIPIMSMGTGDHATCLAMAVTSLPARQALEPTHPPQPPDC